MAAAIRIRNGGSGESHGFAGDACEAPRLGLAFSNVPGGPGVNVRSELRCERSAGAMDGSGSVWRLRSGVCGISVCVRISQRDSHRANDRHRAFLLLPAAAGLLWCSIESAHDFGRVPLRYLLACRRTFDSMGFQGASANCDLGRGTECAIAPVALAGPQDVLRGARSPDRHTSKRVLCVAASWGNVRLALSGMADFDRGIFVDGVQ